MASATPFAAPPTKRLYAAVIDFVSIGAIALVLSPIDFEVGLSTKIDGLVAAVYFVYQSAFLHFWRGQTPGRLLLDITVVSKSGAAIGVVQAVVRSATRVIALILTTDFAWKYVLPHYGTYTVPLFPLIEVGLLYTAVAGTTLADLVGGTVTINTPPPQPHRAPAAPMYSATDGEFGYRPSSKPHRPFKRTSIRYLSA